MIYHINMNFKGSEISPFNNITWKFMALLVIFACSVLQKQQISNHKVFPWKLWFSGWGEGWLKEYGAHKREGLSVIPRTCMKLAAAVSTHNLSTPVVRWEGDKRIFRSCQSSKPDILRFSVGPRWGTLLSCWPYLLTRDNTWTMVSLTSGTFCVDHMFWYVYYSNEKQVE